MYGIKRIQGKITTLSPLFSGGNEKTGITVSLNRMAYLVNGERVEVPCVSGNEVRGYLRRLIMADYLDKSGYELDLETKEGKHLFHTLFTGGILSEAEGQMQGAIDLTFKRKIYDKILPARLLGFAFGNQMIEGKLKVSAMLPLCKEIQKFLPDQYASKLSLYEMLSVQFQTRRDDLRAPRESKSDDQAIQMIIEQEVFTPGAEFYHEFAVEDPDLLSVATLARMIELWKEKPYIGGKSSIGYGQLKLEYAQLDSAPYFDFIALNKDSVSKTLAEFEAMFK